MPTAIVNGGTRGIGAAIATALRREGWTVAAPGKDECDCRNYLGVQSYANRFKQIDLLVNCAGLYHGAMLQRETQGSLNSLLATNLIGTWNWIQAVLPTMRKQQGGYIINISSMSAVRPRPGISSYALTKAAVNSLTQSLIQEEVRDGIRATAICPGDTDTEMGRRIAPIPQLLPVGDTVKTVLWLLSLSETAIVPVVCIERKGRYTA